MPTDLRNDDSGAVLNVAFVQRLSFEIQELCEVSDRLQQESRRVRLQATDAKNLAAFAREWSAEICREARLDARAKGEAGHRRA